MNSVKSVIMSLMVVLAGSAGVGAKTVGFGFSGSGADVDFFPGVSVNTVVDLAGYERREVASNVWLQVSATVAGGAAAAGHVSSEGLGAVGNPGGNQLSAGESLALSFYDAATGGNPVAVEINQITFGNFGGTAGVDDALLVKTGVLADIPLSANTNATGTGFTYTQLDPTVAQGNGLLVFNQAISNAVLTLKDASTGQGGSRLKQLVFTETVPTNTYVYEPPTNRPNIIYIIADDMGYSDLGCFGGEIETPNIDSLAKDGLVFRQHYTCAKCEPSRTSLLSGMFHLKAGMSLKDGKPVTLGQMLQRAGYKTYLSGKWHMDDLSNDPMTRGFDGFYGLRSGASSYYNPFSQGLIYSNSTQLTEADKPADFYTTDYFASEGIKFIQQSRQNNPDQPIFLYLGFTAPHANLQAPEALVNKYRGRYTEGWDILRARRLARQRELGIFPEPWQPAVRSEFTPAWNALPPAARDWEDYRMAAYAAMVERMDYNIGLVLQAIGPSGLNMADNTLIYFVSDNGGAPFDRTSINPGLPGTAASTWSVGPGWAWMSNTPFRYGKQSQHNGGVLTPMIVRWPTGIKNPGKIIDDPTHLMDVMATLTDTVGLDFAAAFPASKTLDGISIKPLFEEKTLPDRTIGFEFANDNWGYLAYPYKLVSLRNRPWELYNLATDRAETRNLARDQTALVDTLGAASIAWFLERDSRNFSGVEPRTSDYTGYQDGYVEPLTQAENFKLPVWFSKSAIGNVTRFTAEDANYTDVIQAGLDGAGIGSVADAFGFLHRSFTGDGEVAAKVVGFAGTGIDAGAGVMLRESLAADAPFVMAQVIRNGATNGTARLVYRTAAGSAVQSAGGITAPLPVYVRLVRAGNGFTASYSTDARHYSVVASNVLPLNVSVQAGIAYDADVTAGGSTGSIQVAFYSQSDSAEYAARDLDGDGYGELLDYAHGLTFGDISNRIPHIATEDGNVTISYARRKESGLAYQIMMTSNLKAPFSLDAGDWQSVGSAEPFADGLTEKVRYRYTGGMGSNGFFRVLVE